MSRAGHRWSEEELRACVRSYADLWKAQRTGSSEDAALAIKKLAAGPLAGRPAGTPRMRFGNLSYVLEFIGQPLLSGFVPLRNISDRERNRLAAMFADEGIF